MKVNNIDWVDVISHIAWATASTVMVTMVIFWFMQMSKESAEFWQTCLNTGGMSIAGQCVKGAAGLKEVMP